MTDESILLAYRKPPTNAWAKKTLGVQRPLMKNANHKVALAKIH